MSTDEQEKPRARPSRAPSAAVVERDNPEAAVTARIVPEGVEVARVGQAILGYTHKPKASQKQLPQHGFRDKRLAEVLRLLRYRVEDRKKMRAWTGSTLYQQMTPETDSALQADELQAIATAASVINDPDDLQAWADKHLVLPRGPDIAWLIGRMRDERAAGNSRPIPLTAKEAGDLITLSPRERAQAGISTMRPWHMSDEQFEAHQRELAECREFNKREARKAKRAAAGARRGRPPKFTDEAERKAARAEKARTKRRNDNPTRLRAKRDRKDDPT